MHTDNFWLLPENYLNLIYKQIFPPHKTTSRKGLNFNMSENQLSKEHFEKENSEQGMKKNFTKYSLEKEGAEASRKKK